MRCLSSLFLVLVLLARVAMTAGPSAGEHLDRHDHGRSQANAVAEPFASAASPQDPGVDALAEGQLPACQHQPASHCCQMATSLDAVDVPTSMPPGRRTVERPRVPGPGPVRGPVFGIFRPPAIG